MPDPTREPPKDSVDITVLGDLPTRKYLTPDGKVVTIHPDVTLYDEWAEMKKILEADE